MKEETVTISAALYNKLIKDSNKLNEISNENPAFIRINKSISGKYDSIDVISTTDDGIKEMIRLIEESDRQKERYRMLLDSIKDECENKDYVFNIRVDLDIFDRIKFLFKNRMTIIGDQGSHSITVW